MNITEFESLLQQSDLAFVEAIETPAFQSMLEHDFSFYIALDEGLRWRLLYGPVSYTHLTLPTIYSV